MQIHGIVMTATLQEESPAGENVEMVLTVQGVGRGQPRRIVIPMDVLVANPGIELETIQGHAFEADVEEVSPSRWIVKAIGFAHNRVLREEG